MKKSLTIALGSIAVVLLAVTVILAVKYRDQGERYNMTRLSEEAVRAQFDAALVSIAEIQDSLNAIAPAEDRVSRLSQQAESGTVTRTQKDQMLSTISGLRESIANSNRRIRDLEAGLKGSEAKIGGLQKVIDGLKRSVAEKERAIAMLNGRVDSLNVTVAGLQTEVQQGQEKIRAGEETIASQQQTIEEKRRELGTIYYVVGTKKELQKKGIIRKAGGVLGIGKSTLLTGNFRPEDFTPVDTDMATDIVIPGTEPKILSAQTAGSYELQAEGAASRLLIRDAQEFRKLKYLVIEVKERTEQQAEMQTN